ncbi:NACHT domain-containing protein [Rhizobium sp. CF142]|uniref:NACHT domain-containing protein n=1 Tax=Rhizobium sp. CF142 TaxID=1144314 RepID=UPI0012F69202|nr:hypothetical protein [Rhizobium sp. CF142]
MSRGDNDFKAQTKLQLAQRVGWLCSNPDCPKLTVGPQKGADGFVKLGEAAHITAASPGGARYDALLTAEERRDFSNGIWLCRDHAHQIDHDETHFTVEMLRRWKRDAEARAFEQLATGGIAKTISLGPELIEELRGLAASLNLPAEEDLPNIQQRLRESASRHLNAFEGLPEWPVHAVKLRMEVQFSSRNHSVLDVDRLGPALQAVGEISIVAAPGTGKSTTLVQLGRRLVDQGPIPILIPLAEWASDAGDLFAWTVNRNAFLGTRSEHLKFLAHHGELALLLDGWNELEGDGRKRLLSQLKGLRRDYPLLLICMSTRQQTIQAPVNGPQIQIRPLSQQQQLVVARALKGDAGEQVLDHAWRTAGLRDLTAIPLYLSVLLDVSGINGLPKTKEEILRRFVEKHESVPERAEILDQELHGQHSKILEGLAIAAMVAANTTISQDKAFSVIKEIQERLIAEGQLASAIQPKIVLEILVNTHILERTASASFSFQHQQFQEWYASHHVEQQMLAVRKPKPILTDEFSVTVLDNRSWEEAILFAAERLGRRDSQGVEAIAAIIAVCLQLDPMLSAEILVRSPPAVWGKVGDEIQKFARQWHQLGKVDRAVAFMIATARPEFADVIWPLIASSDSQIQLPVLHSGRRFRATVLGSHLENDIASLDENIRERLLSGLIHEGDADTLNLAAELAKRDTSAKVKSEVFGALMFRLAEKQARELLSSSDDEVWKRVAAQGYAEDVSNKEIADRLQALQDSLLEKEGSLAPLLEVLIEQEPIPHQRIVEIIANSKFDIDANKSGWALGRAQKRAPAAVAEAMLLRLKEGLPLPWRPEEYLTGVPIQDEGPISETVLGDQFSHEQKLSAARVVGPLTVKAMIDKHSAQWTDKNAPNGHLSEENYKIRRLEENLILATRPLAFFDAICTFDEAAQPETISALARLISRHGDDPNQSELSLDANQHAQVATVLSKWAKKLLASTTATRHDLAEVVAAMKRLPDPRYVPLIARMLDEDLLQRRAAREAWRAHRSRGSIPSDVSTSYSWTYRDALVAIGTDQVKELLIKYLRDPDFSEDAAIGLKLILEKVVVRREKDKSPFRSWPDFSLAKLNRARRTANKLESTDIAEAIFTVVANMVSDNADTQRLIKASRLAGIAATMPHGDRQILLQTLLTAPISAPAKLYLTTSMVIGGITIEANVLHGGLQQLFAEAKTQSWLLGTDNSEVFKWIELFPFSDDPLAILLALDIAREQLRSVAPWQLRGLLVAIGKMPGPAANQMLSLLVEWQPGLLKEYEWYRSLLATWTPNSLELLENISAGRYGTENDVSFGGYQLPSEVANLIKTMTDGEEVLIERFERANVATQKQFLASVISEFSSTGSFLTLVKDSVGRHVLNQRLDMTLREHAYRHNALTPDGNSYELIPADASSLRRDLFELFISSDADIASFALACLETIEDLRDHFGGIDSEPRHPHILSGRPWPEIAATG